MSQQLFKQLDRLFRVVLISLVILLGSQVRVGRATPQAAAMQPALSHQVFDVNCISTPSIDSNYIKLVDLATFTVHSSDSIVELTFNGRIFVSNFSSGTGAVFELRVNNATSTEGRARANLRAAEAGGGGRQVSITGFFTGLEAGEHTASMWVRASNTGMGTTAMVDPGCWSTDVLIVKEHVPFGLSFFPAVIKP